MSGPGRTDEQVQQAVLERYASAARSSLTATGSGCCGGPSDCGPARDSTANDPITSGLYEESDTPFSAALAASLGCGNPTALAELQPGEDVLDLGSGGGLDVLLSARRVGPGGTAFGLDMTSEMLELAERHRAEADVQNAQFLHGAIESVPLPDGAVDVVISNCVINLSTDKRAVIGESFRVLRSGGRFAVSDIVLLRDIPSSLLGVTSLWTGCIAGSLRDDDFVARLHAAGFENASVEVTRRYDRDELQDLAGHLRDEDVPAGMTREALVDALEGTFASAFVRADKP